MQAGMRRADPSIECDLCPLGDGGEGTLDALVSALGGRMEQASVLGPLGHPLQASYGLCRGGELAVIELAQASGLGLVPPSLRDPTKTTTFGTRSEERRVGKECRYRW